MLYYVQVCLIAAYCAKKFGESTTLSLSGCANIKTSEVKTFEKCKELITSQTTVDAIYFTYATKTCTYTPDRSTCSPRTISGGMMIFRKQSTFPIKCPGEQVRS